MALIQTTLLVLITTEHLQQQQPGGLFRDLHQPDSLYVAQTQGTLPVQATPEHLLQHQQGGLQTGQPKGQPHLLSLTVVPTPEIQLALQTTGHQQLHQ